MDLALRAFAVEIKDERDGMPQRKGYVRSLARRPDHMLVFDFETRVDATQALAFGSYQYYVDSVCIEEGLIYADDLSSKEREVLTRYAATHMPFATSREKRKLRVVSQSLFIKWFYSAAYTGRCLVVCFNSPFDLSRLACDVREARGRSAGGFSLILARYADGNEIGHRPRIRIKHIDGKRSLIEFTGRAAPDLADKIPDGSIDGQPDERFVFRGNFLDLKTLTFTLRDRSFSLESACDEFGVEHGKQRAARHGVIDDTYIAYNRRDVLATAELAFKALADYDRHPIALEVTRALSPASVGKAYLREMGIRSHGERQAFPMEYLGFAQSAFFGGRTSTHIRKVPVPVVYTDFMSMYPTVNSLMGLWEFVIAERVTVVEHCEQEITDFLLSLTAEALFDQATWPKLTAFARVVPDGDILPTRAQYAATHDWQVAVNHLYGTSDDPNDAIWYALPDLAASTLLTGRVPRIVDAFRVVPEGTLAGLKSVKLLGEVSIDPTKVDFFRTIIEERVKRSNDPSLSAAEQKRYKRDLKVLANATSYGIFAEIIAHEARASVRVTCYDIDGEPFVCEARRPEEPGRYYFPVLSSIITSAARLMLALLEHCVAELGGTYTMEDTDSMAIVATKRGGRIRLPNATINDGLRAYRALSWREVDQIASRFEALNPYDREIVKGSILKIEDDNYE